MGRKKKSNLLWTGAEWDEDKLRRTWEAIDSIAKNRYGLTYYEPQFEITNYETMLANQAVTGGIPGGYAHWSFGKDYLASLKEYKGGKSGIAYELIVNTDPAITYIMDTNTMAQQLLVMAHAGVGHSCFFKNNYMFKNGVPPKYIVPFMEYAANFIDTCEEKYGIDEVTAALDMCHSLQAQSVDTTDRFVYKDYLKKQIDFNTAIEKDYNELYKDLVKKQDLINTPPIVPEHNLLYFIEKNSPILQDWEREVCRIVRVVAQYFYPQGCTKLMNEGFATFWEYVLINDLYKDGYVDDGAYMEFLIDHTAVAHCVPSLTNYLNPYKFGFSIFQEIRRICENPTKEDKTLFPELIGVKWLDAVMDAMVNYNDSSFITQFLTPKVLRDLKLAQVASTGLTLYDTMSNYALMEFEVENIQSDECFKAFRKKLSTYYLHDYHTPDVYVKDYSRIDNTLKLGYNKKYRQDLETEDAGEVIKYISQLMGIPFGKTTLSQRSEK